MHIIEHDATGVSRYFCTSKNILLLISHQKKDPTFAGIDSLWKNFKWFWLLQTFWTFQKYPVASFCQISYFQVAFWLADRTLCSAHHSACVHIIGVSILYGGINFGRLNFTGAQVLRLCYRSISIDYDDTLPSFLTPVNPYFTFCYEHNLRFFKY